MILGTPFNPANYPVLVHVSERTYTQTLKSFERYTKVKYLNSITEVDLVDVLYVPRFSIDHLRSLNLIKFYKDLVKVLKSRCGRSYKVIFHTLDIYSHTESITTILNSFSDLVLTPANNPHPSQFEGNTSLYTLDYFTDKFEVDYANKVDKVCIPVNGYNLIKAVGECGSRISRIAQFVEDHRHIQFDIYGTGWGLMRSYLPDNVTIKGCSMDTRIYSEYKWVLDLHPTDVWGSAKYHNYCNNEYYTLRNWIDRKMVSSRVYWALSGLAVTLTDKVYLYDSYWCRPACTYDPFYVSEGGIDECKLRACRDSFLPENRDLSGLFDTISKLA